jgi:hypothetical protein
MARSPRPAKLRLLVLLAFPAAIAIAQGCTGEPPAPSDPASLLARDASAMEIAHEPVPDTEREPPPFGDSFAHGVGWS